MARNAAWGALALLLLSASLGIASAQSEAGASIISTTTMVFRLEGNATGNFSTTMQKTFSDQLRALLQNYNFMSVAVSDYVTEPGYIDVSCRLVDATDAQNLTSTWEAIANQAVVSHTFVSTFNALLSNQGVQGNVTLQSINGAPTAAGVTVTISVNLSVDGVSANANKQDVLTPITTFLGDHGQATLSSTNDTSKGITSNITATMDANQLPQFWFFISNNTALAAAMAPLGSNLTTSIDSYTVISAAAEAPTPGSLAPATSAATPPATSNSSSNAPAADTASVTSAPNVPPVSSSASGTVTMNIGMTIYGSDVQPFTPEIQFQTASSMAGVFWIIIGTGSVQIVSFTSYNATYEPASTAKGSTQQYGRKLLQVSVLPMAPAASGNASIPATNVTFAVTLPSASQNSLLVLQSSSPTVRQQFGGWFVTQMAARGYTIDADVDSVTVSTVTGGAPSPTSTPATSSGSSSSGGSSNTGAIVGGVVGGIVGLALITLLAVWLYTHNKRKRNLHNKGGVLDSDEDTFDTHYKTGNMTSPTNQWGDSAKNSDHCLSTQDAKQLKDTVTSILSIGNGSSMSGGTPFLRSENFDSAHIDSVRQLLAQLKQQESARLTETSDRQASALMSALASLAPGSEYYEKYVMEQGQRKGIDSILSFAACKDNPQQKVVIKFIPDHQLYKHEKQFYDNRHMLDGETAAEYIPLLFDTFTGTNVIDTAEDEPIPPSLVLERGNFSLAEWMSGIASLEGLKLEEVDSTSTLYNLCKAVEFLHARSLCHRALTPQALVWFANQKRWKLISFGNWARTGDVAPPSYNIRYAAPELLLADIKGERDVKVSEAADMWAVGLLAFEILAGRKVFPADISDEDVMCMLLGLTKLPWEENPEFFTDNLPTSARNLVADLLQRNPAGRKPMSTVLHSPLFTSDDGPGGANAESQTQVTNFTAIFSDY